jgi:phage terminase large subunit
MSKKKTHPNDLESENALEVPQFRQFNISKLIGQGYDEYWWWHGRYAVCKGSRASKKSFTTAYWIILNMMKYPLANTLVVRKVSGTNKDSTFALLMQIIYSLGLDDEWYAHISPLEIICRKTHQKILFRGLDEPQKLSSITVERGVLCWMWVEEAYQITNEADFDIVDQSIRGQMPEGYFPHIMITFNPWHREHWLKRRFFDTPNKETLAMTTNYLINEFISDFDKSYFEDLKERNPRLYQVAGLGDWGVSEGLIYSDWEEREFDVGEIMKRNTVLALFGLDFGFTDPTAFVALMLDTATRTIYVYDEWYQTGVHNIDIANKLKEMGYQNERIVCDSAQPESIYELQTLGLSRVTGAIKGQDSVEWGIQKCQQYHVVILPKCVNFLTEISMYAYDQDRMGKLMNRPCHDFSHGMDAWRYAVSEMLYRTGQIEGLVIGPKEDAQSTVYQRNRAESEHPEEFVSKYVF